MIKIAPSILSADFSRLGDEIKAASDAGADYIHLDVMDGHFVPNLTIGPKVVEAAARNTDLPLDVHLMLDNPDRFIDDFASAGANILSVHVEVLPHLHRTIQTIRDRGMKPAVVLNPSTPLSTLDYILEDLDMVLIMSVNPGFGGQSFIPSSLKKIAALRDTISARALEVDIEVDGGIKTANIAEVAQAGANVFVSGSGVFRTPDYRETITQMRAAATAVWKK